MPAQFRSLQLANHLHLFNTQSPQRTYGKMSTMKALVMKGERQASVVSDRPLPQLRSSYIIVKPVAVALNPTDWKHIANLNRPGLLCGCDYAGIVEKTGTGYTKNWKVGDRISGLAHGGNSKQPEDGAFAEHIVVKADVQWRLPDQMSFEEGSTLGVGVVTCGQGLFQTLKLDLPTDGAQKKDEYVLIYGGSTATGVLGIQFLKL
jgi:NADPH:quinone reductase-like Zn-dependent oxidoreductase